MGERLTGDELNESIEALRELLDEYDKATYVEALPEGAYTHETGVMARADAAIHELEQEVRTVWQERDTARKWAAAWKRAAKTERHTRRKLAASRRAFFRAITELGEAREEAERLRAMLDKATTFRVGEMRHSGGRALEDVFVEAREIGDEPRWIVRHGMNRLDPSGEWYIRLDYEDIAYASWSTLEEAWAAAEAAIAAGEGE